MASFSSSNFNLFEFEFEVNFSAWKIVLNRKENQMNGLYYSQGRKLGSIYDFNKKIWKMKKKYWLFVLFFYFGLRSIFQVGKSFWTGRRIKLMAYKFLFQEKERKRMKEYCLFLCSLLFFFCSSSFFEVNFSSWQIVLNRKENWRLDSELPYNCRMQWW